jgi:hypothetical protein
MDTIQEIEAVATEIGRHHLTGNLINDKNFCSCGATIRIFDQHFWSPSHDGFDQHVAEELAQAGLLGALLEPPRVGEEIVVGGCVRTVTALHSRGQLRITLDTPMAPKEKEDSGA